MTKLNKIVKRTAAGRIREAGKVKVRDGEPCDHAGCLAHQSHSCEGCGRVAGKGNIYENPFEIKRRKGKKHA